MTIWIKNENKFLTILNYKYKITVFQNVKSIFNMKYKLDKYIVAAL